MASEWARARDLKLVVEQFFPDYRVKPVPNRDVTQIKSALEQVDRVALCRQDPDLTATTAHEFVTRNRDCLFFSLGRHGDQALRESALGGASDDPETVKIWRSIIRKAKSEMHKGATIRSAHSSARQTAPSHLHSRGAHKLAEQGVKMLPAAGSDEFVFDDVSR